MVHIFICPECRSEHSEPARAHFFLTVLCLDCELELELREARLEIDVVPSAA